MSQSRVTRGDLVLRAENLSHGYGSGTVLVNANIFVAPGELVQIRGRNGAGKSTLLRILVGLLAPNRGDVSICGFDPFLARVHAMNCCSYLSDVPFFYERLTGHEHLSVVASLRKGPAKRALEIASELGLSDRDLGSRVDTFSAGLKQKLAFAATFCGSPRVLLLDEPFGAMDVESREIAHEVLRKYAVDGGSALAVTHEPGFEKVSDVRVLTLMDGLLHESAVV